MWNTELTNLKNEYIIYKNIKNLKINVNNNLLNNLFSN